MLKAGFVLTDCEDGKFWVLDCGPGTDADCAAELCRSFLDDLDGGSVKEELVLQCGSDFKGAALYIDGFYWELPAWEFGGLVARLGKKRGVKKKDKPKG